MLINISEYKPFKDGKTLDTEKFNQAINYLSENGGGILNIEKGVYLVGNILLQDNVYLNLEIGAKLIASPNYKDFSHAESSVIAEQSTYGFIFAKNKKNIGILGYGEIDGNAQYYHSNQLDSLGYRKPNTHRIRTVIFENCHNIMIKDITIKNSAMWTLHCISCNDGKIENVKIFNNFSYTNTDAIDIDGCKNFIISQCYIRTADDGICLKTSKKISELDTTCENILIKDCQIESHSSALKIGTESFNDFINIIFTNCIISRSNRGLSLVSRDGGNIKNIIFSNIIIDTKLTHACHWGKADPIYITTKKRHPEYSKCGKIENIKFDNIHITSEGAINFHSENKENVHNIYLTNITQHQIISTSDQRGTYDLRPPCNPNQNNNVGMNNAYFIPKGDVYPFGVHKYPNGIPAVFISGIDKQEIHLSNCKFTRDEDPDWASNYIDIN